MNLKYLKIEIKYINYLNTEIKYEGYIKQQNDEIEKLNKQESLILPEDIDYNKIKVTIRSCSKIKSNYADDTRTSFNFWSFACGYNCIINLFKQ